MSEFKEITMLHDRVCIHLDSRSEKTEGGPIILPGIAQYPAVWGTVGAAGPDCDELKPGDRVYVPRTVGTHFKQGGRDYVILREGQVLGVETE